MGIATLPAQAQEAPAPASSASAMPAMQGMSMTPQTSMDATTPSAKSPMPATHQDGHDPSAMSGMHGAGDMAHTDHVDSSMQAMPGMQHGESNTMQGMSMGAMQGGSAPPDARDPDYSDGISFAPDHDVHMHGDSRFGMLAVDRLEYVYGDHAKGASLEGRAWYGGDLDRAVLEFEGDSSGGRVTDSRVEALWSHAVSAYWDTQLGVRHDGGEGPSRDWVAFGVQGLAPYWFDVQAEVYAGSSGRTAARVEVEYDVLFTQRLILTPKFELNAYGKDDPARGIARGVSDAGFGLRLRYEIRRRFAPYLGIEWSRRLGASAGLARRAGEPVLERNWVAGVRMWF
ncbi:copper resistance protein B [Oleiagrimonas sp. MCCC 1A03011]|uniref:copper resistance protein B n=1 Tax=Oleiagrimonas sp. MCCC 1A03011 TaxID=1926883 RepID=UPI000DDB7A2E|nr:copper resistance protein B [Oleiagrimonas sp. MCCC 1A03011]